MIDETLSRIIELMKEKRIQDQDMIEYLGLPRGSFSNWRREKGKSYYEHIVKIADRLNVTVDYLLRGYNPDTSTLTNDEMELFYIFRYLSPEKKTALLQMMKVLV